MSATENTAAATPRYRSRGASVDLSPLARPMSLRSTLLPAVVLCLGTACSCSDSESGVAVHGPFGGFDGPALDLLARKPDVVTEMPGAIVPVGDAANTTTFGASEGPGWSQTDHKLPEPDERHYRETNQAQAEILLPATRPTERELVMDLWCARPAGSEPARVSVSLNGIELAHGGLAVGLKPAQVRVHAPEQAWLEGVNRLELVVPIVQREGRRAWDTLALASHTYGREARLGLDIEKRTAHFVDGTGARYALELASDAEIELEGEATGPGFLSVRTGSMDPRTGEAELEGGDPATFVAARRESLRGRLRLPRRAGAVRLIELEWYAPEGSELALSKLVVRESAPGQRPPIVFVSIDTFAARHLALYGYERATSPELERFRRDAVLFERCFTNAPWTLPSYLSVMSGLYPRAHAVGQEFQAGSDIGPDDLWQLADNRWTLAEALRARGYRTAGFVDTLWLSPRYRVNQGFDNYNGEGAMARFEDPHAHIEHIVERLVPRWLATNDAAHPPFLFLHALDAHGPYLPNEPFRDVFAGKLAEERTEVPAGSINQTYRTMPSWMSRTTQPDERIPEEPTVPLEEVVARYDESLLKVDAYLGKLFAHLRERGLYDGCVIVVTGDHGEHFGPGMYGHGLMQESVLHVPLLLKLPANAHAGESVSAPVALVDVYPTLLALAGIPPDASRLHGTSLLALLGGARVPEGRAILSEDGHVEQYALTLDCWRLVEEYPGSESSESSLLTHPKVSDEWLRANAPELLTQPLTGALLKELLARPGFPEKIKALREIVKGPYYSLYDLCRDAEQRHDLAAAEPERFSRMKALLEVEKQRSHAARGQARVSGVREALPPQALEALHAIGYGGEDAGEDEDGK